MRVTPDFPARMLFQASGTRLPTGEMIPRPVTTTLRLDKWAPGRPSSGLGVGLDVVDGLLDRGDLFRFLVGNPGLELFLERHHQFHRVERIRAEVVDERGLVLDVRLVHAQLLGNYLFDTLLDVFHSDPLSSTGCFSG